MIISCIVTYNRLDLTKITVESYLNATQIPHFLVVVDNASEDGTVDYLKSTPGIDSIISLPQNYGPGRACNIGWEHGLEQYPDAEFLHRSDNDLFYRTDWDNYSLEVFDAMPRLGQFGILDLRDQHFPGEAPEFLYEEGGQRVNKYYPNIGGNHLTRSELWHKGLRHIELSWADGGGNEDEMFSRGVGELGYMFAHTVYPLAVTLGVWWGYDPHKRHREYYRTTYKQRLNSNIYPNVSMGEYERDS